MFGYYYTYLAMLELVLKGWIGLVGGIAFINGVQCFRNPGMIQKKIYSNTPASDLAIRLFGTWNIMSALVRAGCAWDFNNSMLYALTELSFLLAFLYFFFEITVYKTIPVSASVIAPLIISSITPLVMLVYSLY